MKNLFSTIHLVFALIIWLIMGSCTTTREIHHQIMLHDTVRLSQHDTVRQWHIQHDSIFLHDSVYWQGNQMVKERKHEHWHFVYDTLHRVHLDTLFHARERQEQQRTATSSTPRDSRAQACAMPPKRLLPEGATFRVHFSRQPLALCPTA